MFIVKFLNGDNPYYLAAWEEGDPARTHQEGCARRFKTQSDAEEAKEKAIAENPHRYKQRPKCVIVEVFES